MQTPERVALIGGSILLSSTLVLGLKTSASTVLPKISGPIYELTASDKQKQQDAHNKWWNSLSDFDKAYETAKQNNQKTGTWGTSKYYIDQNGNMHVGNGQVQGNTADLLGSDSNNIKGFTFDSGAQHSSDNTMNSNDVQKRQEQEAHDRWWNGLSDFDKGNETAKQNHWQTGTWGSSKYYIDDQNNLHVGDGQVQGNTSDLLGDKSNDIKNVDFTNNAKHSDDNLMNSNAVKQKQQQEQQQKQQQEQQAQQQRQQQQAAANSSSSSPTYVPPSSYTANSNSNNSGGESETTKQINWQYSTDNPINNPDPFKKPTSGTIGPNYDGGSYSGGTPSTSSQYSGGSYSGGTPSTTGGNSLGSSGGSALNSGHSSSSSSGSSGISFPSAPKSKKSKK